jgi:Flp pilus assembly protein CpaB
MNTARIVVPTEASAAGGIAAYLAGGPYTQPAQAERVAQWPTDKTAKLELKPEQAETPAFAQQSGTLALRRANGVAARDNSTEEQASKLDERASLACRGALGRMAAQK